MSQQTVDGMTTDLANALLDAGAVLPTHVSSGDDDTVDVLTARAYRHPVLGERTVVRLVPRALGEADDLTMDFLGFARPERVVEVGQVRQQALGFPAWALVNDPANGHHALALVKEMERLARKAKSRIGPAKEGFDALGEQLARAVPHFLPTYYEQAGRAFLAADSSSYAAMMFGKAREAEQVYGLDVDPERQHAVFLEFALAGALSAKALSAHARDLATRCAPDVAYERFRRLCVERTLGGLPPYAAMPTDLRRLAKKAKLDQTEADERLIADIVAAPALLLAPESFWTAYRAPLAGLARRQPQLRGRLLGMLPENCSSEAWLTVLTEAGATEALYAPADTVAEETASPDGPAGWLSRFANQRARRYRRDEPRLPALLALVEQMVDRLVADGAPLTLTRHDLDLDLVDLCLARGVQVALPEHGSINLPVGSWLKDQIPGRRDLLALAADPRFATRLGDAVEEVLASRSRYGQQPDAQLLRDVTAVPGLTEALRGWWSRLADRVTGAGLPEIHHQLGRLAPVSYPETFAVNPDAARRIADHSLTPLLGRTLRAGLLDEYGWPALEQAAARLDEIASAKDEDSTHLIPQWPYLIVQRGRLVLVVGHDGIVMEHLLRVPAKYLQYYWNLRLRYVDDQLLVGYGWGSDSWAYWSGNPDDPFQLGDGAFQNPGQSLALPGGGRTSGGRPFLVGDHSEQHVGRVVTDGRSYWVLTRVDDRQVWHEYDPATGERGRASLPSFFEDGAVDGSWLANEASSLRTAPDGLADSPLGIRDRLVGWRLRVTPQDVEYGQSVDGRAFRLSRKDGSHRNLVGAIRFPGSDLDHGVIWRSQWRSSEATVITPDGLATGKYDVGVHTGPFAAGTSLVPPVSFWHYLRPRDLPGSTALRALTDAQADELLTEATELTGPTDGLAEESDVRELVARTLPQLTDPALIAGVAGVVRLAAGHARRLRSFASALDGQAVVVPATVEQGPQLVADELINAAVGDLLNSCWNRRDSAARLFLLLGRAVSCAPDSSTADRGWRLRTSILAPEDPSHPTETPESDEVLDRVDRDWLDLLGMLPAVLYRAASPQLTRVHRDALLELLDICVDSGLFTPGARARRLTLIADAVPTVQRGDVVEVGQRRLFILRVDVRDNEVYALDYAPDGVFGPVPHARITGETVLELGTVSPELLAAFVSAIRTNGPVPWRPELVGKLSVEVGMSRAEAVHLISGLPTGQSTSDEDAGPDSTPLAELGITSTELNTARQTWGQHSRAARRRFLGMLLPAEVQTLWTDGPCLDQLRAHWIERYGHRTPVADELIVALDRAGAAAPMGSSEFLHGIAAPETCRWLNHTQRADEDGVGAESMMIAIARAVPWLAYHLPANHALRAGLPKAVSLLRQRLADPELRLRVGYLDQGKIEKLAALLGVTAVTDPSGSITVGPLFFPPDTGWRVVDLRPAALTGAEDPLLGVVTSRLSSANPRTVEALRLVLGNRIDTMLDADPTTEGAVEAPHDPSRSVPELVTEVATTHGLTADAATLYLQLLALPNPTDRNVAGWTGWKPARLKAARAALAATDLVVEAKRSRAGRSLFLPGGWLALKSPHLPVERWKIPLLTLDADGGTALDIVLPIAPAPRLFVMAWDRVRNGDAPRFDELVTERRR
ncbi:hypothetical protein GCM10027290_18720 [Micromonospora sonneratiae]|uniref:DNA-binding protein n=1 Tax=Micromonospora sonneratiae TaxID=1184706 RepID=A0ABW3Y882_9ACTN